MIENNFIQPFFDFPDASITDGINQKSYRYLDFYKIVCSVEKEIDFHNTQVNSVVVIYGYRNSFDALVLFFSCIKNNLIPFIVEKGNLHYTDNLHYNLLLTSEKIESKESTLVKLKSFQYGNVYQQVSKNIYIGDYQDFAVVSSSGSTSALTKRILLGRRETLSNIQSNQKALTLKGQDTTLVLLPVSYSYGLIAQFLSHLFLGSSIVLADKALGILQLSKLIDTHKISNIFLTPLMARLLLHYNKALTTIENQLRFITLGGDKPHQMIIKKLQKVFKCPIYLTYGLAEAGPRVATKIHHLNDMFDLTLGTANPGIAFSIVPSNKYICLENSQKEIGFLNITTPSLYRGYIVADQLLKPKYKNKLKTQDICFKDRAGVHILGRDGDYIFQDGKMIWFYEIGSNFYENPNVLKVKIQKGTSDKLEIQVFYRNQITTGCFIEKLQQKYGLIENKEYFIQLKEFNNSQYK